MSHQNKDKSDPTAPIEPEERPQVYYSAVQHPSAPPPSQPYPGSYQNTDAPYDPYNSAPHTFHDTTHSHDDDTDTQCRLCLQGEGNDLIAPCKCTGSMKYVHRSCLDRWRAMSPRAESFSRCDQCLASYQFITLSDSLPWTKYLKYVLLVGLDILFFLALWQVAVFLCTAVYWIFDSLVLESWTVKTVREALNAHIPAGLQYYVYGVALFFFFLGIVGLLVGFYSLIMRCMGGRNSDASYSTYPDYSGISYGHNSYLFSDWFLIWFLMSHPTGHYGGPGCGDCLFVPVACASTDCNNCDCLSGGGGGGGEGGAAILGILAVILLVIVIVIIAVGIVFGTLLTLAIVAGICRKHYVILRKKDECKRLIVKDLLNEQNNKVSVMEPVVV